MMSIDIFFPKKKNNSQVLESKKKNGGLVPHLGVL